jgi:hypothetical protein
MTTVLYWDFNTLFQINSTIFHSKYTIHFHYLSFISMSFMTFFPLLNTFYLMSSFFFQKRCWYVIWMHALLLIYVLICSKMCSHIILTPEMLIYFLLPLRSNAFFHFKVFFSCWELSIQLSRHISSTSKCFCSDQYGKHEL